MIGGWTLPQVVAAIRPKGAGVLNLTAKTTAANAAVTIARMTVSRPSRILWGDGNISNLPANSTAAISHEYAVAGTYNVLVEQARAITQIQLDNAKLGGLNTAQLKRSAITYFYVTLVTGCTIRSSDMVAWRPLTWQLSLMPAGTYAIDSADMAAWRPTVWYLYSMPAGTYAIDSADMAAWRPLNVYLMSMPAGSYVFAASCMRSWTTARNLRFNDLGLGESVVDTILADVYAGKATFTYATPTLNVGGANAAPSGAYQNVCPPTSGLETVYALANGNCVAEGPEWSITYNGGTAP